ncbi:hypothetical protein TNCV_4350301 [Trichonephila clavipes]|nr:hypothetical protein TNCV_4350301 [Trichonephila clavipes]
MVTDSWPACWEVGDITRIQICIATHGWKRLRSALGGVVHKSIRGNRPTLPQFFELSPHSEENGTVFEQPAGRYASDRRKKMHE